MVIIKGFLGKVYFRNDEYWRGDIWQSAVWPTPEAVLDEFLERKWDVLETLQTNCETYSDYDRDADEEDNEECVKKYVAMIAELRAGLTPEGIEDAFDEIEVAVEAIDVNLPQLTEYEWAKICESKSL